MKYYPVYLRREEIERIYVLLLQGDEDISHLFRILLERIAEEDATKEINRVDEQT